MAKFTFNDNGQRAEDDLNIDADDDLHLDGDGLADFPDLDDDPDEDSDDAGDDAEEVWTSEDLSKPVVPTRGCAVSFFLDNKRHHALCLAVIDDEVLLEHKGSRRSLLFIGKITEIVPRIRRGVVSATITVGALKPCRYRAVPKRWLQEMVRTGQSWKGLEGGGKLAPSPGELLNGQMELF